MVFGWFQSDHAIGLPASLSIRNRIFVLDVKGSKSTRQSGHTTATMVRMRLFSASGIFANQLVGLHHALNRAGSQLGDHLSGIRTWWFVTQIAARRLALRYT